MLQFFYLPRRHYKCFIAFNIVFWLVVIASLLLFAFSFQAVPITSIGLSYNHFFDRYGQLQTSGRYLRDPFTVYDNFQKGESIILITNMSCLTSSKQRIVINASFAYVMAQGLLKKMTKQVGDQYQNQARAIVTNQILRQVSTYTLEQIYRTYNKKDGFLSGLMNKLQLTFKEFNSGTKPFTLATTISAFWITQLRSV